jgi:urease beta subunit
MSGLIATQKDIDPHHPAINHFDPGKANPVDLVRFGGETYISDGHHTLAGAQLARQRVRARIWHDPDDG